MLVAWPSAYVVRHTFADGFTSLATAFADPDVVHALLLTAQVAVAAVVINTVFGVGVALLLVRTRFPGQRALSALVDLPLSVSPVVVGLALVLVYNPRTGWFGPWLAEHGVDIIFSRPGMVMATCFVALPLVIREVVPVLEELGEDQEQAARSLGAGTRQTFLRITLPSIKWAVVYGVVLSLARSIGEFGAVKVVAGNISGQSVVATVLVQQKYQNFEQDTAYAVAFVLALVAVLCLVVVALLRPSEGER
ncbi:sulfate ABC transporter permease subunit [Nocardioides sp. GY 10127]|nr:sulfate ABC transporter permease subunit [Nocardioides sp. GY 10127]